MSIKFSVIVPIYKVQDYLEECIESIIHQTYENLEIILVDDGSPDECPAICDRYAAQDSRIKVIHKENGGLSDARNAGIEIATGDYISFVDSDDWLAKDAYEHLAQAVLKNNPQIVCFGNYDVYGARMEKGTCPKRLTYITGEEALLMLLQGDIGGYACFKIFARTLFDGILFPKGELYEDIAIMPRLLLKAEKIALLDKRFYYYRHRTGSILNTDFTDRHMVLLKHAKECMKLADSRGTTYQDAAKHFYAQSLIGTMSRINNSSSKVRRQYKKEYKWCKEEAKKYRKSIVGLKQTTKYYLLMCGLYRYVLPLYHRVE